MANSQDLIKEAEVGEKEECRQIFFCGGKIGRELSLSLFLFGWLVERGGEGRGGEKRREGKGRKKMGICCRLKAVD